MQFTRDKLTSKKFISEIWGNFFYETWTRRLFATIYEVPEDLTLYTL